MDHVLGSASIRRIGRLAFPVFAFECEDGDSGREVLARLGRDGWFRVFFGRGRRVVLPDGTEWRVAAVEVGGAIEPIVTSERGKLAQATPHGRRSYRIDGRDFAYNLYPTSGTVVGKTTWSLRERDTSLATFESRSMCAEQPVALAAALLCFALIKYGVPGEANFLVPEFRWA